MRKMLLGGFFLVAAVIIGALVAAGAQNIPFLSWLAFGKSIGLSTSSPMIIDLSVIKLAFGFEMGLTIAHIICFIGAFFAYKRLVRAFHLDGSPRNLPMIIDEDDKRGK